MRELINSSLHDGDSSTDFLDKNRAASFSKQFSEIRIELYAYLVSLIGADISSAEDCLQEVAMVLWNKHDPSWENEDYRRYSFGCAKIVISAHHRKMSKLNKKVSYLAPDIVESLSSAILQCEKEDSELAVGRLAALEACINKLSLKEKELLDARYNKEGNYKTIVDVATHHGWGTDAVYKRLERLRTSLFKCTSKRMNQASS